MNIESLKVFYKTIYHKSITAAAKELYLSQPAVSLQIKSLEKELKLTLIERSNKGVLPTEAGKVIYKYAENILAQYQCMYDEAHECADIPERKLTISSCATLGFYALPCSLYEFKEKFGEAEIITENCFSDDVISHVRDRGVDIGFIEGTYDDDQIESIKLGQTQMHIVGSPSIYTNGQFDLEQLHKTNLFIICGKCTLRRIIESSFMKAEVDLSDLKINLESPSIESIKAYAIKGMGVAILPYLSIKKEIYNKSLTILDVNDMRFPYVYSMIYKKNSDKMIKREFIKFMMSEGKTKLC